jgi:hypothetical protein
MNLKSSIHIISDVHRNPCYCDSSVKKLCFYDFVPKKAVVPCYVTFAKPSAANTAAVSMNAADMGGYSVCLAQSDKCSDDWRGFGILTASTRNGDR